MLLGVCGIFASCSISPAPSPWSVGEEAGRTWLAHPEDPVALERYHRSIAKLVSWYDSLPENERAAACRAAHLTVEIENTGETGLRRFTLADQVKGRRLDHNHIRPGIGVPVMAWRPNDGSNPLDKYRPPEGLYVSVTALLVPRADKQPGWTLRFLACAERDTITLAGRKWPVAADFSAPVATLVQHAEALRRSGPSDMLDSTHSARKEKLYLIQAYDPNRIPIVMVHGLRSTPVAFGNLVNDLYSDPRIRSRYQVWHYHYPTGYPVMRNAAVFRQVLKDTLRAVDPEGDDYATNHLVLLGHSMGGILSHTLVSESGYQVWDSVCRVRPEKLQAPPASRKLLESMLIFHPDRRVRRVIFIATPHRGSSLADNCSAFMAGLRPLLVHHRGDLPPYLVKLVDEGKFSSIRTLSKNSPALMTLSTLPPQVPFHSIIGQRWPGPAATGSDNVVPYSSSHLDGARSELIVRSGHNTFRHQKAVEEVRRILLEHR